MNTPAPTTPRTSPHMAVAVSCIALFTDMLIYGILIPLLPLMPAVERAGSSATGLLFAAYAAMMIAATPLAGRLVDRRGPRGPLLVALLGLAAACLLFAVGGPYWLLLVSRLLQGAAAGLGWVASLALIAAAIPLERRGTYLGLAMSMVSVGTLAGPPLAGWLARDHGHAAPFVLAASVLVVDGVLRIIFVRPTPPRADDPATALDVLRVRGSWPVVVLIALGSAVTSAIEPILPVRLAVGLGLDTAGIGLLFALLVVIGAVLNPMVGAALSRVSPRLLALVGATLAVAGLMLSQPARNNANTAVGLLGLVLGAAAVVFPLVKMSMCFRKTVVDRGAIRAGGKKYGWPDSRSSLYVAGDRVVMVDREGIPVPLLGTGGASGGFARREKTAAAQCEEIWSWGVAVGATGETGHYIPLRNGEQQREREVFERRAGLVFDR